MPEQGKLSKIKYQSYPIDIAFRIEKSDGRYELLIRISGYESKKFSLQIREHDLAQLSEELHKKLSNMVRNNGDIDLTNEDLYSLAKVGNDAFIQIFGNIDEALLEIIKEIIADGDKCLEITSDEFLFPWELIYPNDPHEEDTLSIKSFWGLKHIVNRVLCSKIPSPSLINFCPRLGLLAYEGLPTVKSSEVPQFYDYQNQSLINLIHLVFTTTEAEDLRTEFKTFWQNDFDLTHFACHAQHDNAYGKSYIRINENFDVTIQELRTFGIEIKDKPLVIINACEAGIMNPLSVSNFVNIFLNLGARGAIATECTVPDQFAADFSRKFYEYFLEQKRPLGESLLATRQYFLNEYNNPSGLLYSMYAPPNIQLAGD